MLKLRLVACRRRWGLTCQGWVLLLTLTATGPALWCWRGEAFFSETARVPAPVLVVESWIGTQALRSAAAEFSSGKYQWLVVTGGFSDDRWSMQRASFSQMADFELRAVGVPQEKILIATTDTRSQRTYAGAVTAWHRLEQAGLPPVNINVFTFGTHARRSRLVFAKAAPTGVRVGVISWHPPEYADEAWWNSSERGEDLLKETIGYAFEVVLNGGRSRRDFPAGGASSSPVSVYHGISDPGPPPPRASEHLSRFNPAHS